MVVPSLHASHTLLNTLYAIAFGQIVFRLVEEALDCVGNERLVQNGGTTAVMAAPGELVDRLVFTNLSVKAYCTVCMEIFSIHSYVVIKYLIQKIAPHTECFKQMFYICHQSTLHQVSLI